MLTHIDEKGRARMVDVTNKNITSRRASAVAFVSMSKETLKKISSGNIAKGDVIQVARIAGIQAAKKTPELIPLCHPLSVGSINIDFKTDMKKSVIRIEAEVTGMDRTGLEMEALTAAAVASLTIYDMCKAVQKDITIGPVYLDEKSGGKSGDYKRKS